METAVMHESHVVGLVEACDQLLTEATKEQSAGTASADAMQGVAEGAGGGGSNGAEEGGKRKRQKKRKVPAAAEEEEEAGSQAEGAHNSLAAGEAAAEGFGALRTYHHLLFQVGGARWVLSKLTLSPLWCRSFLCVAPFNR